MNKKVTASLAILAATLFAAHANAAAESRWPNWYVGLHGGMNFYPEADLNVGGTNSSLDTKNGYIVGASLGYVPPTKIPVLSMTRWELEYSFRSNDQDSIDGVVVNDQVESHSVMANLYLDFANSTRWTPYIGGGAGFTDVEFDSPDGDSDDSVFAWQAMGGIEYAPASMPMTAWGLRYKYFNAENVDFDNAGTDAQLEYEAHNVEATARFRF